MHFVISQIYLFVLRFPSPRDQIIINIDVMLVKRKMSITELSEKVCITLANLSILKNGKAKAIRLSTLIAICKVECQPGDILEYRSDE